MPAKSKKQFNFMGMVYAYKKTGKLPESVFNSDKIKEAAKSLTKKQIKEFLNVNKNDLPPYVSAKKLLDKK